MLLEKKKCKIRIQNNKVTTVSAKDFQEIQIISVLSQKYIFLN